MKMAFLTKHKTHSNIIGTQMMKKIVLVWADLRQWKNDRIFINHVQLKRT